MQVEKVKQGTVKTNWNFKHTVTINYSPESNHSDIWSYENICLTTTPAAWPTVNLATFSSLGDLEGNSEKSHSLLCTQRRDLKLVVCSKTQFETNWSVASRSLSSVAFSNCALVFIALSQLLPFKLKPPASFPALLNEAGTRYACHLRRCRNNRNLHSDLSLESTPYMQHLLTLRLWDHTAGLTSAILKSLS